MKTNLIQIGNSRGIRIPKSLIEQFQLQDEIEIIASDKGLLIKPSAQPRSAWENLFKSSPELAEKKNENPSWKSFANKFDKEEWSW